MCILLHLLHLRSTHGTPTSKAARLPLTLAWTYQLVSARLSTLSIASPATDMNRAVAKSEGRWLPTLAVGCCGGGGGGGGGVAGAIAAGGEGGCGAVGSDRTSRTARALTLLRWRVAARRWTMALTPSVGSASTRWLLSYRRPPGSCALEMRG